MLRRLDQRVLPPIGRALSGLSPGARRLRLVMILAAVLSVVVVLLTVYVATRSQASPTGTAAAPVRVGVSPGDSIPGYVRRAQTNLRAQVEAHPASDGTKVVALVSFSGYQTPEQVADLVAGMQSVRAFIHVPVAGKQTSIFNVVAYRVPKDIENAMHARAVRKAQDARNNWDKAAQVQPTSDEKQRLWAMYRDVAETESDESQAYMSLCSCVFGIVVYATPAQLAVLASHGPVRAVDPAPDVTDLQHAIFAPPRPEEDTVADEQDEYPLTTDSDTVAAATLPR